MGSETSDGYTSYSDSTVGVPVSYAYVTPVPVNVVRAPSRDVTRTCDVYVGDGHEPADDTTRYAGYGSDVLWYALCGHSGVQNVEPSSPCHPEQLDEGRRMRGRTNINPFPVTHC